jgi:hypothetical protein
MEQSNYIIHDSTLKNENSGISTKQNKDNIIENNNNITPRNTQEIEKSSVKQSNISSLGIKLADYFEIDYDDLGMNNFLFIK